MAERSLIAVERAHQGLRRFDYFILGISIALCAYVGQTISPERFGWSAYTLEVISVGLLVASAFFGFRRIETQIRMDELNHEILDAYETRAAIVAHDRTKPFINAGTGDVFDSDALDKKLAKIEKVLPGFHDELNKVHQKSEHSYNCRNGLLAFGFLGLFLAKVLQPYFSC